MLGPTLEALSQWLTADVSDSYSSADTAHSSHTDADHFGVPSSHSHSQGTAAAGTDLTSLLSNLTLGLWSSVVGSGGDSSSVGAVAKRAANGASKGGAPIDSCTGVVLHVFIDSPQVCNCCSA